MWHLLTQSNPRIFEGVFFGALLALIAIAALSLTLLSRTGFLPPPPITNTSCIDEKLKFLHEAALGPYDVVAIGSSVTERNLNVGVLRAHAQNIRVLNAAPCYLLMNQTAFLGEFLLNETPLPRILLTVVAPRDFEECAAQPAAFFDTGWTRRYVVRKEDVWPVYVTRFRPKLFVKSLLARAQGKQDPMDEYGSVPLTKASDYWRPARLDGECFAALKRLADAAQARNVWLVVMEMPFNPLWQARYDGEGKTSQAFRQGLRTALTGSSAVLIEGDALPLRGAQFADMVHLYWKDTPALAALIGARLPQGRPQDGIVSVK